MVVFIFMGVCIDDEFAQILGNIKSYDDDLTSKNCENYKKFKVNIFFTK